MCLVINEKETEAVRKALTGKHPKFYKIYAVNPYSGKARIYYYCRGGFVTFTKDGFSKSNRKSMGLSITEKRRKIVNRGIHVYSAKPYGTNDDYNFCVETEVLAEDFIAAGNNKDVVFTKIKVNLKQLLRKAQRVYNCNFAAEYGKQKVQLDIKD